MTNVEVYRGPEPPPPLPAPVIGSTVPDAVYIGRMVDDRRMPIGKVYYGENLNLLTLGPSGCGKSTRIVLPNLLEMQNRSIVATDLKATLCLTTAAYRHMTGNTVKIIDPFGLVKKFAKRFPREYAYLIEHDLIVSCGFNALAQLDPSSETFYDDAALIAEAMIKIQGTDPHWTESAQGLLTGLIMWEVVNKGQAASLDNVRAMLTEADKWEKYYDDEAQKWRERLVAGLSVTAAKMVAEGGYQIASLAGRFLSDTPTDEMESVRSTADTQTRWLLSDPIRADLKKNGVDFNELKTGEKPMTVYVVLPPEMLETHSIWLRLVVSAALRGAMQPGRRRVLCILDEVAALGHLPAFERFYPVCREYGSQFWPFFQDLSQLKRTYEKSWSMMLSSAGVIQSFRAGTGDIETAEWLSKRAGNDTAIADGFSVNNSPGSPGPSVSIQSSQIQVPFLRPETMYGLPDGYMIGFIAGKQYPMLLCAPRYDRIEELAARADANPYRLGF